MKKLSTYNEKRHFDRTPEPAGKPRSASKAPIFVVQKHDATALHYDFRLEAEGVLKSWAVPKGPSLNPKDKRLAMPTEDHPMDYASFEGVIPAGEYGGGPVIVWDNGTYDNLTTDRQGVSIPLEKGVELGHIKFYLHGHKLQGAFALTRTGRAGQRDKWIMIKMADDDAAAGRDLTSEQPQSVISGKVIEDLSPEHHRGGHRR